MGEKGEITRAHIIDVARSLFHLKGYSHTSMDDIVKKSGVTKGNLYYYFSSKEELGGAVVDQLLSQRLLDEVNYTVARNPIRQILDMFQRVEKELVENGCKGGCLFGNFALEVSDHYDGLRKKLEKAFLRWELQVEGILESGKRGGIFHATLNPKTAACFIVATLEGAILLSKVRRDPRAFRGCTSMVKVFLEKYRA